MCECELPEMWEVSMCEIKCEMPELVAGVCVEECELSGIVGGVYVCE